MQLHGGEPLTTGELYLREVLTAAGQPTTSAENALSTNGIRLDAPWLDCR